MKRFRFRLEPLLRIRRQRDRQAESRQWQARQLYEAAQAEVDFLYAQLVESAQAVEARLGQTVEPESWVAHYQHMTQVRRAADAAETSAQRARAVLEEANRLRRRTAMELESLELLRRQQWQEHRKHTARTEQSRLDDIYQRRDLAAAHSVHDSIEADGRPLP